MSTDQKPKVYGKLTPTAESYLMGILMLRSVACCDPEVQQAALIVDGQDRELSFGVNTLPKKGANQVVNWHQQERDRALITAEEAAINRMIRDFCPTADNYTNAIMYTTCLPSTRGVRRCLEVNSSFREFTIKTVIFGPMRSEIFDEDDWKNAKSLASDYNLDMRPFEGNLNWVRDKIKQLSSLF